MLHATPTTVHFHYDIEKAGHRGKSRLLNSLIETNLCRVQVLNVDIILNDVQH